MNALPRGHLYTNPDAKHESFRYIAVMRFIHDPRVDDIAYATNEAESYLRIVHDALLGQSKGRLRPEQVASMADPTNSVMVEGQTHRLLRSGSGPLQGEVFFRAVLPLFQRDGEGMKHVTAAVGRAKNVSKQRLSTHWLPRHVGATQSFADVGNIFTDPLYKNRKLATAVLLEMGGVYPADMDSGVNIPVNLYPSLVTTLTEQYGFVQDGKGDSVPFCGHSVRMVPYRGRSIGNLMKLVLERSGFDEPRPIRRLGSL